MEPVGAVDEAEGQATPSEKTEDLLAMVKKLQEEGSLEPQIKDLINRINELQQGPAEKASEELQEAHMLREALHRELDVLNGEKVHLEEVLSKKQETLRILQPLCLEKDSECQRKHMLLDCAEPTSVPSIQERSMERRLGLDVKEHRQKRIGQHKGLWEFHMLEQRLAQEIRVLESNKAQLLTEEMLMRAKLEEVGCRLNSPLEAVGSLPQRAGSPLILEATGMGLKAETDESRAQVPAHTQDAPEEAASKGDGDCRAPSTSCEKHPEPPAALAPTPH